ncbi:uncharacterized protein LOC122012551 [Zingiber officinale]|uniref:Uncharacterized protein n=1 Tax=Zingiber officinale TaxID=94328 RepID=A0A8J5FI00_ZINOF|nr:uncharacterized protein LOC122012551 [Zingiber officinale]KAG6487726.1 hypothetical protein ZIOFF_056323 [Zingiber officinale]
MAFAALRRIPIHLGRTSPSHLRQPLSRTFASSALVDAVSPPSATGSNKIADRIVKLSAIDHHENKHAIIGLVGHTLLRALINGGLIDPASHRLEEIDACSGECEVHIAQEWLDKLPPMSYDERYILTHEHLVRTARPQKRVFNKHARLACQIVLQHELQGMVVVVPKPKPWDIP